MPHRPREGISDLTTGDKAWIRASRALGGSFLLGALPRSPKARAGLKGQAGGLALGLLGPRQSLGVAAGAGTQPAELGANPARRCQALGAEPCGAWPPSCPAQGPRYSLALPTDTPPGQTPRRANPWDTLQDHPGVPGRTGGRPQRTRAGPARGPHSLITGTVPGGVQGQSCRRTSDGSAHKLAALWQRRVSLRL